MRGVILILLFVSGAALAEAWRPANDADIIESLPQGAPSGLALATPAATLDAAISAAQASLQRGQRLSDPREYGYAEAILQPWRQRQPDEPRIAVLGSRIQQFRHDFDAARNQLQRVLARDPRHAEAWLLLATIEQVQGNYAQARSACAHLVGQGDLLVPITCGAAIGALTGNATGSATLLQRQLDSSLDSAAGTRIWAWTVLGEIQVRSGADDAAASSFGKALAIDADDVYVRSAWADLELQRQRPQVALDLIGDRTTADALLLRAAIAAKRAGAPNAAELQAAFAERVDEMMRRGDLSHRRELARAALELDQQPAQALQLALTNWKIQREPADAALVLASATAAGRKADADEVVAFVRDNKLEDQQLIRLIEALK